MAKGYLLDTHTLLWWWTDASQLSRRAYQTIMDSDNVLYISPINIWEMAIKHHKGKLPQATPILKNIDFLIDSSGFKTVNLNIKHAKRAGSYPNAHADPFDRMLVAQADCENLIFISKDSQLTDFGVPMLW